MWSESFLHEKHRRMNLSNIDKRSTMRKEYDFSQARKNPYASQLKKQITIRLDEDSIGYFKEISEQVGIPYQSLINLYLRDCAAQNRKLDLRWKWSVNLLARNSPWVLDTFPKKTSSFFLITCGSVHGTACLRHVLEMPLHDLTYPNILQRIRHINYYMSVTFFLCSWNL